MTAAKTDNPLVRKFSLLLQLSDQEEEILRHLQENCEEIPEKTDLLRSGEDYPCTFIIKEGWAYSYKLLEDGQQQVLSYWLQGDFIGLFATVFRKAEYSVRTLTDVSVCRIRPEQIMKVFSDSPLLAAAICWTVARDGAILREHVTRIGRRNAYERTGHLLLELLGRLEAVGLVDKNAFEFPITQELLADTLGLTPVHVNRTLKALKKDGMIDYDVNTIVIINRIGLIEKTGFDPSYIKMTQLPEALESSFGND
ncbi:MAG: Crp/Fnr family transcriptional regulator [Gammaproteobacteria bacterium]|nr:Crp/Fnr family transcriptional regulator [Gammaproteobacteria bacterium]